MDNCNSPDSSLAVWFDYIHNFQWANPHFTGNCCCNDIVKLSWSQKHFIDLTMTEKGGEKFGTKGYTVGYYLWSGRIDLRIFSFRSHSWRLRKY